MWAHNMDERVRENTAHSRQKMAQNSSNGERASTLLIHCYWSNEEVLIVILLKVISTERDSLSKNFFRSSPLLLFPHYDSPSSQQQQSPKLLQIFPWKLCAIFFCLLSSPPTLWLLEKYVRAKQRDGENIKLNENFLRRVCSLNSEWWWVLLE